MNNIHILGHRLKYIIELRKKVHFYHFRFKKSSIPLFINFNKNGPLLETCLFELTCCSEKIKIKYIERE